MDRRADQYPSLRALRRALSVGETQHLTRAAGRLARSQSAVTRSIAGLEQFLGVRLFERTATGMAQTRHGEVLFRRVRAAADQMARVEAEVARRAPANRCGGVRFRSLFDLGNASIFTFLAVCDQRDYRQAAQYLGVTPSTVRKLLMKLERQIGTPLFEREPRGLVCLNELGTLFAICTKRALWEIRAGLDELRSLDGQVSGQVRVGVMSTARSFLVPRAVDHLRRLHPQVLVFVYWGNYHDMKAALHCGDIDFIIGSLRAEEASSPDKDTVVLMRDRIQIIVRAEHPLAKAKEVSLEDLLAYDWILPPTYFPLRIWFENLLQTQRLNAPKPFIETGSLAILRGTLLESDCVTVSTRLQCWHDTAERGLLRALPVAAVSRASVEHPFHLHLTRRLNALLSPAALALYATVIDVAQSIEKDALRDADRKLVAAPCRAAESAA
jgi:LysR family transcriptional regulator of gallate degradation